METNKQKIIKILHGCKTEYKDCEILADSILTTLFDVPPPEGDAIAETAILRKALQNMIIKINERLRTASTDCCTGSNTDANYFVERIRAIIKEAENNT